MTRLFQNPRQIIVKTNAQGEPVAIYRGGKGDKVVSVGRNWRVNENWWREEISREYFQIETTGGLVGEVYHDLLSGSWYLHRIYD